MLSSDCRANRPHLGLIQRKQPLRDFVAKWPRVLRYALFIGMFYVILIYGVSVADGAGVFMYAQF